MINQIIANYLVSNKRLVIPELGAFIRKDGDGRIVFVPFLKKDDGVLSAQLEANYGLGRDEAEAVIGEYVEHIRQQIASKGEFLIDGVGVMHMDANDLMVFDYAPGMSAGAGTGTVAGGGAIQPGPDGMGDMFAQPVPVHPVMQQPVSKSAGKDIGVQPEGTETRSVSKPSVYADNVQSTTSEHQPAMAESKVADIPQVEQEVQKPVSTPVENTLGRDQERPVPMSGGEREKENASVERPMQNDVPNVGVENHSMHGQSIAGRGSASPVRETIADREATHRKSLNDLYARRDEAAAGANSMPYGQQQSQTFVPPVRKTVADRESSEKRGGSVIKDRVAETKRDNREAVQRNATSAQMGQRSARSLYSGQTVREVRNSQNDEKERYVAPPIPKQRYQRPAAANPVQYQNKKKADLIMIIAIVAAVIAILAMLYGLLFGQDPVEELKDSVMPAQVEVVDDLPGEDVTVEP